MMKVYFFKLYYSITAVLGSWGGPSFLLFCPWPIAFQKNNCAIVYCFVMMEKYVDAFALLAKKKKKNTSK